MAQVAEDFRSSGPQGHAEMRVRPVVAVTVLVGFTAAGVFLAQRAMSFEGAGAGLVWLLFGTVAALAVLRWIRASRAGRDHEGEPVVVIRRDGTAVHSDARRHRRHVPARRATTLHMRDGRQIAARIVDISIAGVSVEARLTDIELMAVDRVGLRAAGPIRRTAKGAVFGFEALLDPQPFDASFVL